MAVPFGNILSVVSNCPEIWAAPRYDAGIVTASHVVF
jgi:hypothetical protein